MSKTISGARASLKLNGVKVAYVANVSINEENSTIPVQVIDQLQVAEHAEVGHDVSFSASLFKIAENSVSAMGIRPDNIDDLLTQPELTMELYDRIGDTVIYTISGVKFTGGQGSIDARGVFQGVWNFVGKIGSGL